MKIVLGVHQFLPDLAGGTEQLTAATARELRSLGYDVRIVCGLPHTRPDARAPEGREYEVEGVQVTGMPFFPDGAPRRTIIEAEYLSLSIRERRSCDAIDLARSLERAMAERDRPRFTCGDAHRAGIRGRPYRSIRALFEGRSGSARNPAGHAAS